MLVSVVLVILSPQSHRRHKTTSQPNNQRRKISSPTNHQRNKTTNATKTTKATKPPVQQNHQHDKTTSTTKSPAQQNIQSKNISNATNTSKAEALAQCFLWWVGDFSPFALPSGPAKTSVPCRAAMVYLQLSFRKRVPVHSLYDA